MENNFESITISYPKEKLGEKGFENLLKYVEAKTEIFKKAFRTDYLPIISDEEKVSFPWFDPESTPEQINAYTKFICGLCQKMAESRCITAKKKKIENEKYEMREILLKIGFIGPEYASARKILTSHLSGHSAFKDGVGKRRKEEKDLTQDEIESVLEEDCEYDSDYEIPYEIVAKLQKF